MLKKIAALLFLLSSMCLAQSTVTLNGNIGYHSGKGFTGKLIVSLPRASVLNTCTSPASVVKNSPLYIVVTNGVVTSTSNFVPTACFVPSVPYYVQILDSTNLPVDTENWYFIPDSTGAMNVGNLVQSGFGGPIVVSVPLPIVSNPSGTQTITQPVGTALTVNTLTVTGVSTGVTASAFTITPVQCTSGWFATGIQATGNANCSLISTGVASFNGRAGAVVPTAGDYSWGMISSTPTFYYQSLYGNTSIAPQEPGLNFSSNFTLTDAPGSYTNVDLLSVGAPATYANPSSITTDSKGRVTAVTGNSTLCSSYLGTACSLLPGNMMIEGGTSGCDPSGGCTISFTPAFPSICTSVTVSTFGSADRIIYITSISNTSFSVSNNGSGTGFTWTAIGH